MLEAGHHVRPHGQGNRLQGIGINFNGDLIVRTLDQQPGRQTKGLLPADRSIGIPKGGKNWKTHKSNVIEPARIDIPWVSVYRFLTRFGFCLWHIRFGSDQQAAHNQCTYHHGNGAPLGGPQLLALFPRR
jgi:hypothetical protein